MSELADASSKSAEHPLSTCTVCASPMRARVFAGPHGFKAPRSDSSPPPLFNFSRTVSPETDTDRPTAFTVGPPSGTARLLSVTVQP